MIPKESKDKSELIVLAVISLVLFTLSLFGFFLTEPGACHGLSFIGIPVFGFWMIGRGIILLESFSHGRKIRGIGLIVSTIIVPIIVIGILGLVTYGIYWSLTAKERDTQQMVATVADTASSVPNNEFFQRLVAKANTIGWWQSVWTVKMAENGRYVLHISDEHFAVADALRAHTDLGQQAHERCVKYVTYVLQMCHNRLSALDSVQLTLSCSANGDIVYYDANFVLQGDSLPTDQLLIQNVAESGLHILKDTASGKSLVEQPR
jgi:Tfp pilus assembly protein PilE